MAEAWERVQALNHQLARLIQQLETRVVAPVVTIHDQKNAVLNIFKSRLLAHVAAQPASEATAPDPEPAPLRPRL